MKTTVELMKTDRLELIPAMIEFCDAEARGRADGGLLGGARTHLLAAAGVRA
jgi:hypothetical protein